jgi:hypothetical protein
MFIRWDHDTGEAIGFPQTVKTSGNDWLPFVEGPELVNTATQWNEYVYVAEGDYVTIAVHGDPTPLYSQRRQDEYAPLADQLDMLWHDINNNSLNSDGKFFKHIKSVKDKYPKESYNERNRDRGSSDQTR